MTAAAETALRVFRPGGPSIPSRPLIDFERQMKVAVGTAFQAQFYENAVALIAFGFPGNGKTAFARSVANRLQSVGFYVAWLYCVKLTRLSSEEIVRVQSQLRLLHDNSLHRPLMMVAVEVDAMETALVEKPELAIVLDELLSLVLESRNNRGGQVLLATASSPMSVTERLLPFLPTLVYFNWPNELGEAVRYLEAFGIPKASKVAESMLTQAEQQEIVYSTGSLVRGAARARETWPELGNLSVEEIVEIITAMCLPIPKEEQEDYRRYHRRFILEAEATAEDWDESFGTKVAEEYVELARREDGKSA